MKRANLIIKGERAIRSVRKWNGKNPFKKLGYDIYITIPRSKYEEERSLLKPYDIVFLKGLSIDTLLKTKIDKTSEKEAKEKLKKYFNNKNLPLLDPLSEYEFSYVTSKGNKNFKGKVLSMSSCYLRVYNEDLCIARKIMYASIEYTKKC